MVPTAMPLMLPARKIPGVVNDACSTTVTLLGQSVKDHSLAHLVGCALRTSSYGPLRSIGVSVNAGVVRLAGQVPSYYMKQVAQETALGIPGTQQIQNKLNVIRQP